MKGYYIRTGKPFKATMSGKCLSCKKPIVIGDKIAIVYFTHGIKMPFHYDCKETERIKDSKKKDSPV